MIYFLLYIDAWSNEFKFINEVDGPVHYSIFNVQKNDAGVHDFYPVGDYNGELLKICSIEFRE